MNTTSRACISHTYLTHVSNTKQSNKRIEYLKNHFHIKNINTIN